MQIKRNTNSRFLSGFRTPKSEILWKSDARFFIVHVGNIMLSNGHYKKISITDYFVNNQQRATNNDNGSELEHSGYSERMSSVHEDTNFISRNKTTNIPLYHAGSAEEVVCDGLHIAMKDTFFPWRTWQTVSKKYGSSKDTGIMVHRQLRHYYTCMKLKKKTTATTCDCGLDFSKKMKMSKYTKEIIKHLNENNIVVDETEVPICDPEANIITWIDAIGHLSNNPEVIVKISLKTGYSPKFKSDSHGFIFDNMGNNKIPCTTENIYHLQSLCEDIILFKVYNVRPNISFTLYAYEERDEQMNAYDRMTQPQEKKKKRDIHCIESRYPEWCKVIQTRNEIHESLKNRKRRKNSVS